MTAASVVAITLVSLIAVPAELRTRAERSSYQETSAPADVERFLRVLAHRDQRFQLVPSGRSVEGRPIWSMQAGRGPVVLLIGGIHAGECAGKEAILELLRDEAQRSNPRWIDRLRLVVVPDFNPDGNARRGKHHRPHQLGPVAGMGVRHNAQRLNLNRDFVKLETPEVRHLVRLANRIDPLLFVDTHTTDGSEHRHQLLYDIPHHPAVPRAITDYLKNQLLPAVKERLADDGVAATYYGNFTADRSAWQTFGFGARYSTEYMGLRGTFALLSEAYARRPFRTRIRATRLFLEHLLDYTAEHAQVMLEMRRAARQVKPGQRVPVHGRLVPDGTVDLIVAGDDGADRTVRLPHIARVDPTRTVQVPWAYAIDPQEARLVDRLLWHGLAVYRVSQSASTVVEAFVPERIERASTPFEGHRLTRVTVRRKRQERTIPERWYIVPVRQRLGLLAIALLDPEAHDSLCTWNFLDHRLQPGRALPVLALPKRAELGLEPVRRVEPAMKLTVEMIYGPRGRIPFSGRFPPVVHWLPDSRHYLRRTRNGWLKIDVRTGAEQPAYDTRALADAWRRVPGTSEGEAARLARRGWDVLAADGTRGVVTLDNDLYLVDLRQSTVRRLTHDAAVEELVTFSPDGRLLAYVKSYSLYVYDLTAGTERRVTPEGDEVHRYGKLDWVYQEELYGRGNYRGYWWSPDSRHLAFLYLDETNVHRYPIVRHLPYRARLEQEFYPKAGDPLPVVKLGLVSARGGDVTWVDLDQVVPGERLVVRVGFHPSGSRVLFQVQDREQTWLKLMEATLDGRIGRTLVHERSTAWVEVLGEPVWLDEHRFLWLSDRSGNRHVYLIDARTGGARPVTRGNWDVTDLYGASPDGRYAYIRALKDSPLTPQLYRVELATGSLKRLSNGRRSHRARFAPKMNYYVDYSSDALTPPAAWLYDATGRRLWAIEPNLVDYHRYVRLGTTRFLSVPARDGFPLECMAVLPVDFRPGKKRYPVFRYVYGGPQAPVVQRRWAGSRMMWFHLLAQRGVLVWVCDNRASTLKGIKHTRQIYGQMGFVELRDLLDSLDWLDRRGWVDRDRIAIHGWSYGGYMSAFAALHSTAFRLAIAGAPVTDWRNYDAIYTERYMRMPQHNPKGYQRTRLASRAAHLSGRLLLIHGMADDNVHPANTLQLVHALQQAGKRFELMVYPEARHGVGDPAGVYHLYRMMTDTILEELLAEPAKQ